MKREILVGLAAFGALGTVLGGGFLINTSQKNVAPGKSDEMVRQITMASTRIEVLKSAPNPDGKAPRRTLVGRIEGADREKFLALVRLQDNELKPFERASEYRLRFFREQQILGALDIYFNRGWGYAQGPKDEPDAPFENARVMRPTFGPRLRAFLEGLKAEEAGSRT